MTPDQRTLPTIGGAFLLALAVAAPAAAEPGYPPSYGSNGVFGVTTTNDQRATAHIPPGTYRVEQSPSMYPYLSPPGSWLRCNNFPCSPRNPENIIATGEAVRDIPTFVQILPTDTAVSLMNVTLTIAN